MTKRWSSTASMDGKTKRQASKSARREAIDELGPATLCDDGAFCSDPWCLRLGCALTRKHEQEVKEEK